MAERYRYVDLITEEGIELYIEEWTEIKKTPRGAWVQRFYMGHSIGKKRFVLDGSGNRRCHQTKEQAWGSFKARKRSQFNRAKENMMRAEYAIEQIAKLVDAPAESSVLGKPDFWRSYVFN